MPALSAAMPTVSPAAARRPAIIPGAASGSSPIRSRCIDDMPTPSMQRLRMVEIPLAAPVMIAGIRAATVLTVGIATLCTYIGAGGLGDFIQRGLSRTDPRLTLLGAVPAAIMAVVLSLGIRLIEKLCRRA